MLSCGEGLNAILVQSYIHSNLQICMLACCLLFLILVCFVLSVDLASWPAVKNTLKKVKQFMKATNKCKGHPCLDMSSNLLRDIFR